MSLGRNKFRVILSCLLLLIDCFYTTAQNNPIFKVIPVEQGLSNKAIPAIAEDKDGLLWFATQDGLNKYNGYEFKVYQNDPSDTTTLSNNNIFSLIIDKEGFLWLGTENGGLNRFDPNTAQVKCFIHDVHKSESIGSNNIYSIFETKNGSLWIGTLESGINVIDKKTGKIVKRYRTIPGNSNSLSKGAVWNIHEDKQGIIWISTWGGGLDRLDTKTGIFKHFRHEQGNPHSISYDIVGPIYEDKEGIFWISTWGGGLNRFDPKAETFTNYQYSKDNPTGIGSNLVWPIVEDAKGNLWVGTYGSGVNKFNRKTKTFERYANDPENPNSLNFNDVWSLHIDRSGILWIGTEGGGISKYINIKKKVDFYKCKPGTIGIAHNSVRAITEDTTGLIWIGTWDGGLDKLAPKANTITNYKRDVKNGNNTGFNKVKTIYCDKQGTIWLGTYRGGLGQFNRDTKNFIYYTNDTADVQSISDNYTYSIVEDKKGNLWVGTLNGLNIFDRSSKKFRRFLHDVHNEKSISNNTVNIIYPNKNGTLWIGTDFGLNIFNYTTKIFTHFLHDSADEKSIAHSTVYTLFEDKNGTLWIGTRNGLDKFNPTDKSFTHYTIKDGLPSNLIMAIVEDEHERLLISTKNGISRFDKTTNTFINYDITDGIHGTLFFANSACRAKNGKVYFGSTEGLNAFYPDSIENNLYMPPVLITGVKKNNCEIKFVESIYNMEELILPYYENNLSFDFVSLSYTNPEENQYSVKLEGIDREWRYNGTTRYVSYSNLAPGTYTFSVRGSNDDGLWNDKGASLKIIIRPPFWKTLWFYVLCLVLIILGIVAYIKNRERKLLREKRILEQKVDERTAEVVLQKEIVEEQNKEIKDSIRYAKRIQYTLLAPEMLLKQYLSDYFVLFQPKDIVSGDFYWATEKIISSSEGETKLFYLAACDSTGHGVPGAFMSLLNISFLNEAINNENLIKPDEVFNYVRKCLINSVSQDGAQDGMDGILVCIEKSPTGEIKITYSAANNSPILISNGNLSELKADKMPIGKGEKKDDFTLHIIDYKKMDTLYIYSDGYADQFGGPKGKKFKYKQLEELILANSHLSMAEQKDILQKKFEEWKSIMEQVDDILIIGFRV